MIGTTRSRVSFFMNRFRKLGFISYNGRIQVHKSLLNVVLLDQLPDHNAQKPAIAPFASAYICSRSRMHDKSFRGGADKIKYCFCDDNPWLKLPAWKTIAPEAARARRSRAADVDWSALPEKLLPSKADEPTQSQRAETLGKAAAVGVAAGRAGPHRGRRA